MTLQASVRRSGGVCFQSRVRVERFFSVATACLFAALRTCSLIHRRVTGAWWSPRSSKPLPVRLPDRGRFDSYPLRLDSLQRHQDIQCPFSKPLSQVSHKARLPNLIVNIYDRVDSTETEIFEGGDHHVAGADFEADLAFIVCGVSF